MPINPKKPKVKDTSVLSTRQGLLLLFLASSLATFASIQRVNRIFPNISKTLDLEHVLDAPAGFVRKLEESLVVEANPSNSLSLRSDAHSNDKIQKESQQSITQMVEFPWINSTTIPTWLKDYFQWHHRQRVLLNEASYRNDTHNVNRHQFKFLVMTCFHDEVCGGVTDRLRPVLTMLRAAHLSNRILLIYWERPYALEEFLVPQAGGFHWTLPSYMIEDVRERHAYHNWKPFYADPHNEKRILNSVYQSWDYGWLWYNEHLNTMLGEPPALEVFRDVWNVVFQMAPPVQALFDTTFAQMNLESGEFATAHIRALYAIHSRPHSQTVSLVRNALNCASQLRPGGPFLVASDLLDALKEATAYGRERNVTVVTPPYTHEPLHVGLHNESLQPTVPSDFYTAFVDIYLLAQSRCVAVGPGGYGYWAQVLGHDHACWIRHSGERSKTCEWRDAGDAAPALIDGTTTETTMITIPSNLPRSPINLWNHNHTDNSPTMVPEWLKDYFEWHQEQRAKLTPDNFREHRYVIMTCLRGAKCGGMTDRLRPILTHLKVAHMSSRLLFIYWERPFPLEEFLLPPKDGFDWRMPNFLLPELQKTQQSGALEVRRFDKKDPMIVSTMYQSWHYGELLYNNEYKGEDEPDAMAVFRDVWNVVFTPSPPVAKLVYESFDTMGIRPGHYATAHVRALYAIQARGTSDTERMVKNAMNCASQLFPGGPFMVVSDSAEAIKLAEDYGAYRKVTVVAPPYDEQPLHLGLHNESDPSIVASHFYNVFSDMYLIAETRCMVVGKGGFGRWGILLGHEPGCSIFSSGFKAQDCEWKEAAPSNPKHTELKLESAKRPVGEVPIFRAPMA